jgi:hypothetical protein
VRYAVLSAAVTSRLGTLGAARARAATEAAKRERSILGKTGSEAEVAGGNDRFGPRLYSLADAALGGAERFKRGTQLDGGQRRRFRNNMRSR